MRQSLDDAATPLGSASYTPFGVPQAGTPDPFGFTGELHSQDLVYLRARWYDPSSGVFVGRDPFAGFPEQPYSLHPYQYGYSNPVLYTDASGKYAQLPSCELDPVCPDQRPGLAWILADWFLPKMELICFPPSPPKVIPWPKLPADSGFVVGGSAGVSTLTMLGADIPAFMGVEVVLDLFTFEVGKFFYRSEVEGTGFLPISGHVGTEAAQYAGKVWGWSHFYPRNPEPGVANYSGKFYATTYSFGLPHDIVSVDGIYVENETGTMFAGLSGLSVGVNLLPTITTILEERGEAGLAESRSFRHGAFDTPDENDANEFISYIDQSSAIPPLSRGELKQVVRDNAKAWAEVREYQSKCGELPWKRLSEFGRIPFR